MTWTIMSKLKNWEQEDLAKISNLWSIKMLETNKLQLSNSTTINLWMKNRQLKL
jgi:hypothetical protein